MSSLLEVEKICKYFGKLKAVDQVSFEVGEKEILGIAGPNGAGKTTLFNIISGLPYHANSGHIIFSDQFIEAKLAHQICRLGLARTFQKETIFETLNVYENVIIGAAYGQSGRGQKEIQQSAREALAFVGLADMSEHEASHLSLFDKKNLMLASALASQPKLVLLDEPASGLNQPEMDRLAEIFSRINSTGTAIIIIEHQLPLLLKISDRIMILNEGRKLVEGLPGDIIKDARVIEAYLGRRGS